MGSASALTWWRPAWDERGPDGDGHPADSALIPPGICPFRRRHLPTDGMQERSAETVPGRALSSTRSRSSSSNVLWKIRQRPAPGANHPLVAFAEIAGALEVHRDHLMCDPELPARQAKGLIDPVAAGVDDHQVGVASVKPKDHLFNEGIGPPPEFTRDDDSRTLSLAAQWSHEQQHAIHSPSIAGPTPRHAFFAARCIQFLSRAPDHCFLVVRAVVRSVVHY